MTMKKLRRQQWLILAVFLLIAGFTSYKALHLARAVSYWKAHRDEPIRGWMSVGHVAHSYHVPPYVLYRALGLLLTPPDKRPLRDIAKMQHRSMNEIRAILQNAIMHARPPYSPPPDQSPDREGSP